MKLALKTSIAVTAVALLAVATLTYAPVPFFSDRAPFTNCMTLRTGALSVSVSYPDGFVKSHESFQIRLFTTKQFDDKTGNSGPSISIIPLGLEKGASIDKIIQDYSFEPPERRFKASSFNSMPAAESYYKMSNNNYLQEYFVPTKTDTIVVDVERAELSDQEDARLTAVLKTVRIIPTATSAATPVVTECSNWDWF